MYLGLKGYFKDIKNNSLKWNLKNLRWQLRYAWRRAWLGYDDMDMIEMSAYFIERYKAILKDYRKHHHCLFNVPNEYRDVFNKIHFDEKETDIIIDTMIFHLEMMNEDYVEKLLYGKNVYDEDYDVTGYNERYKQISSIMDQNKNAFMKLFSTFFWQLWD